MTPRVQAALLSVLAIALLFACVFAWRNFRVCRDTQGFGRAYCLTFYLVRP